MIKRDSQPWTPAEIATLEWQDDRLPRSARFNDIYYSQDDGLAESVYTFIEGTDLSARLQRHRRNEFTIAETGFGTGLNFLLTWEAWQHAGANRPRLNYIATERYPVTRPDLTRALAAWPGLAASAKALVDAWPVPLKGQHRLLFEQGNVVLDLWFEDTTAALIDLAEQEQRWVDAWYLDGFAPARNPDMWQAGIFQAMAALSRPGATLATFTAAGDVRRGLSAAGFDVQRVPGFGTKRDSLRARWAGRDDERPAEASRWDIAPSSSYRPGSALVIGAGLAGAATAAALARRGITVTVLERDKVASAASGNEQGVLYTRLSRQHSSLTDFTLQSFLFAHRHYQALFTSGQLKAGDDGALCGCFQQSTNEKDLAYLGDVLGTVPELSEVLGPEEASQRLGVGQPSSGYWLPLSGWLHPPAVCRALLAHPNISLIENAGAAQLSVRENGDWRADYHAGSVAADIAVICGGADTADHDRTGWLPLQPIRGQTTTLASELPIADLKAVLCHEGYIAPAREGSHCVGATFAPSSKDTRLEAADNLYNLARLSEAVPAWSTYLAGLDPVILPGRVGVRCASPDYLPITGPVPDLQGFLQEFANLRNNAKQVIDARGPVVPGLYVNTGHGSRGLSSTPLTAECLAAEISREPLPLSRHLRRALLPARFLVRDLKRGKI